MFDGWAGPSSAEWMARSSCLTLAAGMSDPWETMCGMTVLADLSALNYLAVLVAAIAGFAVGAVWYMPAVFGKTWMSLTGRTPESVQGESSTAPMVLAFAAMLVSVFTLALFLGPDAGIATGALAGLLAGVGLAAMAIVVNGLFEARPATLMLINSGYQIVALTLAGAILGAW